jgi:hypothetical protein
VKAVQAFLKTNPTSPHADEARLCLSLHQKISAFRRGDGKPLFVIPFEKLGKPWNNWKDPKVVKGILVIYGKENTQGAALGIHWGGALGTTIASFDDAGAIKPPR